MLDLQTTGMQHFGTSSSEFLEGFRCPQVHGPQDVSPVTDGICSRPVVDVHEQLAIEGISNLSLDSPTEPIQGWYLHVNTVL